MNDLDQLARAARVARPLGAPVAPPDHAGWIWRGFMLSVGAAPLLFVAVLLALVCFQEIVAYEIRSSLNDYQKRVLFQSAHENPPAGAQDPAIYESGSRRHAPYP